MKPYGNSRKQNQTCSYGCCTLGTVRTNHRPVCLQMKRRSKKAARRANKAACDE